MLTSWAVVLASVLLIGAAYAALPGSDGLTGELRFLLSDPSARNTRAANRLLALADRRAPGRAEQAVTALLGDDDPRAATNLLLMVAKWPKRSLDPTAGTGRALLPWALDAGDSPLAELRRDPAIQELADNLLAAAREAGVGLRSIRGQPE